MKKRLPKVMMSTGQAEAAGDLISDPTPAVASFEPIDEMDPQSPLNTEAAESSISFHLSTAPAIVDPSHMKTWTASDAALTRTRAERIVKRHATMAGFGGIVPLPIVNIAGITGLILRMVRMLARLYGVPFERERARSVVISLLGGTLPTGLGVATSSTLIYLLPGSNLLAMAVSSVSAVVCTRGIGYTFIAHFERGGTLAE